MTSLRLLYWWPRLRWCPRYAESAAAVGVGWALKRGVPLFGNYFMHLRYVRRKKWRCTAGTLWCQHRRLATVIACPLLHAESGENEIEILVLVFTTLAVRNRGRVVSPRSCPSRRAYAVFFVAAVKHVRLMMGFHPSVSAMRLRGSGWAATGLFRGFYVALFEKLGLIGASGTIAGQFFWLG